MERRNQQQQRISNRLWQMDRALITLHLSVTIKRQSMVVCKQLSEMSSSRLLSASVKAVGKNFVRTPQRSALVMVTYLFVQYHSTSVKEDCKTGTVSWQECRMPNMANAS